MRVSRSCRHEFSCSSHEALAAGSSGPGKKISSGPGNSDKFMIPFGGTSVCVAFHSSANATKVANVLSKRIELQTRGRERFRRLIVSFGIFILESALVRGGMSEDSPS